MSKANPLPPLARLDYLFEIRDGHIFTRISRSGVAAGVEAGCVDCKSGYRIVKVDYKRIPAHRIVWAMTHRQDPGALFIDHIDRNKLNNHPDNLRLVTVRLNGLNRKMNSNNTSGANGVRFLKGKWYSSGVFHRKFVHLGCFDSKQEAITARQAWEQEQWAA